MFTSFWYRRIVATFILCFAGFGVLHANGANNDGSTGWGFSTANLDKTCKPCDDFYRFAMGGWMKNNPIPAEFPTWGSFTVLADRNQASMRGIVEDAGKSNAPAGSNQQKIFTQAAWTALPLKRLVRNRSRLIWRQLKN
jgi:putative endopeptidase